MGLFVARSFRSECVVVLQQRLEKVIRSGRELIGILTYSAEDRALKDSSQGPDSDCRVKGHDMNQSISKCKSC